MLMSDWRYCFAAQWTPWGPWSVCDGTCGPDNIRSRNRSCSGGFGDNFKRCDGDGVETEVSTKERSSFLAAGIVKFYFDIFILVLNFFARQ